MKFDEANTVQEICWTLRQSDWVRGQNRARINELFNGFPPFTDQEVNDNNIAVNVNFLEGTRIAHEARTQFYSGFLKPGKFFSCRTDAGPTHKRSTFNTVVSKEVNKAMKRSLPYFEKMRSSFALDVLHGIAPSPFRDRDRWCPETLGVEDVLIPGRTLLTMENVPFFALYRTFTGPELIRLTRGGKTDKGWNKKGVDACIDWIDRQSATLFAGNWPEMWTPEKTEERIKSDGGFYASDNAPTINCFDFYFYDDDGEDQGWYRRILIDAWSQPDVNGTRSRLEKPFDGLTGQFLYDSKRRKVATKLSEIINFQFADLSAAAPFRYHSVRSLGFLMYSVCQLQNRMRCKFSECVFEALMMYFRVKSSDDAQRALKVDLVNRGFIDESLQFIPASERFQVNAGLVELGLAENHRLISANASSFSTQPQQPRDSREKTKFEVMSEIQTMTSLVSSALMQAYRYQEFEYREIFRRFCKPNSGDPEVRDFQKAVERQTQIPAKILLNPDAWEIEPDRVMGAGNKTLEMAIAQQLLEMRNLYDPEPQRQILRQATETITDDPGLAEAWVPDQPLKVTDSVHDAQLAAGTLMQGLPVAVKTGMNHIEYVETLMVTMASVIQRCMQKKGATPEEITGLQMLSQHVAGHIQIIAQDPAEKARVKQYGDQLGKLNNAVRALAQQLEEKMKQSQGKDQMDPKDVAKIQAIQVAAKVKADNMAKSHAQRTAQRQVQWELEMKRKAAEGQVEIQKGVHEHSVEVAKSVEQHQLDLAHQQEQHALDMQQQEELGAAELEQQQAAAASAESASGETE